MAKSVITLVAALFLLSAAHSQASHSFFTDFSNAKEYIAEGNKNILVVFAGSDWCRPCIQFKKEILESAEFQQYAEEHLAVLYLDFPSRKKNRLSEEQTAHNERLAERFNPEGSFPKILLLDKKENILKEIKFSNQRPEDFIIQCQQTVIR